MRDRFDRSVVSEAQLGLLRDCQAAVPCRLAGGAALSGAYLGHRLTRDIDLFCAEAAAVRQLVQRLPRLAAARGAELRFLQDAGHFVRAELRDGAGSVTLDLVEERGPDLEPPVQLEGVTVISLADLRAAKLTCLVSRSEPRDLVDLLFLDRAGYPPERDLTLAIRKDAGVDPGILAWLLRDFPTQPLPEMLVELDQSALRRFRDALAERLRRVALPGPVEDR